MNKFKQQQGKKQLSSHLSEQTTIQRDSQQKSKRLKVQLGQLHPRNLKSKERTSLKVSQQKQFNLKTLNISRQGSKTKESTIKNIKNTKNTYQSIEPIKHQNKKIIIRNAQGTKELIIRTPSKSRQRSIEKKNDINQILRKTADAIRYPHKNMIPPFKKNNQKIRSQIKTKPQSAIQQCKYVDEQKIAIVDQNPLCNQCPFGKQEPLIEQDIPIDDATKVELNHNQQEIQIKQLIVPEQKEQKKYQKYIQGQSVVSIQYQFQNQNQKNQMDYLKQNYVKNKQVVEQKRWIPQELIGMGLNTEVYRVLDKKTGKIVAGKKIYKQKQLQQSSMKNLPEVQDLAKRELQIFKLLKHPNIIEYIGHQIKETQTWIYMEYVKQTLQSKSLKSKLLPISTIKHYAKQLLKALQYIHAKKIIHKDIKCSNILIDSNDVLKLCDFSSAKQFDQTASFKAPQTYKGTILWIAPQVLYTNKFTRKSDIWSFACTMIQLITKQSPWYEKHFQNQIIAALFIGQSNQIPKIPQGIPDNLKDLLQKSLIRDPQKRWSAQELLNHGFITQQIN